MNASRPIVVLLALASATCAGVAIGCSGEGEPAEPPRAAASAPDPVARDESGTATGGTDAERAAREKARDERIAREFPLYGLVTGTQLVVRAEAAPEAAVLGWLRVGSQVRLKREPARTPTCSTGWYSLFPRGHACAGQGIEVSETPAPSAVPPPDRDEALPYTYWFVKEPLVPEYHRPPSRDEQRAALALGARVLEVRATNERLAARILAGEIPSEPRGPAVLARFLDRGFFLASTGSEVRAFRRFARSVRGTYIKEAQLEQRRGSSFAGVELDERRTLPLAFARRAARPMLQQPRPDGTVRMVDDDAAAVIERHAVVDGWQRRQRIGDHVYHQIGPDRWVRDWFLSVAERIDPPFRVEDDEPWVHVDLSEQTLVLYRGSRPVYVTLVSSGLDDHRTPTGVFTIQKKLISDTMADLGPDAGDDRYRIEDVPWTQYFSGSIALHGAFWHDRFGLTRSHGCVNLAPRDAHRIFDETWPEVPEGWHGLSTDRTGFRGSRVVVTE